MQLSYSKVEDTAKALSRSLFDIEILFGYMFGNMQFSVKIFLLQCNLDTCYIYIYMKNLKKNMKNLKTKYGGTPQFIL